jgi:hypothetical protein
METLLSTLAAVQDKCTSLADFFGEDASTDVVGVINGFAKAFEVLSVVLNGGY